MKFSIDANLVMYLVGCLFVFAIAVVVLNLMGEGVRLLTEKVDHKKKKVAQKKQR